MTQQTTSSTEPGTLLEALLNVQRDAPALQRDKINPHFKSKYLSLETLHEQVLPLLTANRLAWVTRPVGERPDGSNAALIYELIFVGEGHQLDKAERIAGTMDLAAVKRDPQGQGSAITYARRYSLMAVLGLAADEDDGNAASGGRGGRSNGRRSPGRATTPAPPPGAIDGPTLAAIRKTIKDGKPDEAAVRLALVAAGVVVDDDVKIKDVLPALTQTQGEKLLASLKP